MSGRYSAAGGLGVLVGLAGLSRGIGGRFSGGVNAVLTARYVSQRPDQQVLMPHWPRSIVAGSLFPWLAFLKGWCPDFLNEHVLVAGALLACAISAGGWLLAASDIAHDADRERAARINLFMADPLAEVPERVAGLDDPPTWLRGWGWTNTACFLLVMACVASQVVALSPAS
jgi:hypothetical protein